MNPRPKSAPRGAALRTLGPLLLLALLSGGMFDASARLSEQDPDRPEVLYWFRNPHPLLEPGPMDLNIRYAASSFGASRYDECLGLARWLLDSGEDLRIRAQSAAYLIQSHLARAQFDSARAAAEDLMALAPDTCQELIGRIEATRAPYLRRIARLQRNIGAAATSDEAAGAQLLTGHAHQQAGALERARESYWRVVRDYADSRHSSSALFQMVQIHRLHGDLQGAMTVCTAAARIAPDSSLAVHACRAIPRLCLGHETSSYDQAIEHLGNIALSLPATRAADTARFLSRKLYAAEGLAKLAEEEWTGLVAERPKCRSAEDARASLAELRYATGTRAFTEGDYAKVAEWLARVLQDLDPLVSYSGRSDLTGRAVRLDHMKQRQAVLWLGQAYQKPGRWEKAAEAFRSAAVPGNPTEELALFELGRSQMNTGNHGEAHEAFNRLLGRFPDSAFVNQAEDYVRRLTPAR